MKLDRVKYRDGRPYVEYCIKGSKYIMRAFGEIRPCKFCQKPLFSSFSTIKKGGGKFCNHSCALSFLQRHLGYRWHGGSSHNRHCKLIFQPSHPFAYPNGYVLEHRLVMESILGRFLLPAEVVHHKNGCRTDNRRSNLSLFSTGGRHTSFHHKLRRLQCALSS